MTFYKELKEALHNESEKAFVLVKIGLGYCTFSPIKDRYGNYRYSGWWMTKKYAKKNVGRYAGYTSTIINQLAKEECWKIIKTYPLKDLI